LTDVRFSGLPAVGLVAGFALRRLRVVRS
jgi:hypothetical protein